LCISYTLSSIAAAYQADIYYDTSRDMNEPRLHLLDTPPTTPPDACTGSLCDPTAPSDGENPLSRITISKPDIDKFNSLLEESPECDDCMKITPDGKIKVTNPDGIKVSKSNPVVKKATDEFMADLKKNNPSLFNKLKQLEEEGKLGDEEEEVVEEVEEAFAGKFVAGKAARSVASNSSRRSSRYKDKDDSLDFKSVFDQFRKNKKNKFAGKTVTVGKDQVGVVQDNIFLMVHRRYQERRTQKQFIESQKKISKRKAALGS
ncbi:MAG: hypothetical protein ACR2M7_04615, partial [Bdellovibrionales bacterium]